LRNLKLNEAVGKGLRDGLNKYDKTVHSIEVGKSGLSDLVLAQILESCI
jgi:hypothetical protein